MNNSKAWTCLPESFAMALGISLERMLEMIGHDGSQQVYKNPRYVRGFHLQECIDVALKLNVACVPIEHHFALTPDGLETYQVGTSQEQSARFLNHLKNSNIGIFEGMSIDYSTQKTIGHAAAWLDQKIVDPRGSVYEYEDRQANNFCIIRFWRFLWF